MSIYATDPREYDLTCCEGVFPTHVPGCPQGDTTVPPCVMCGAPDHALCGRCGRCGRGTVAYQTCQLCLEPSDGSVCREARHGTHWPDGPALTACCGALIAEPEVAIARSWRRSRDVTGVQAHEPRRSER